MNKQALIDQLNEARAKRSLPLLLAGEIDNLKLTKKKLERLIYELDNPSEPRPVVKPPAIKILLERLNVSLAKQGKPVLASWKASREKLLERLAQVENASEHVTAKKCPPAIADGADTKRFHTGLHTNPLQKAVERQSKREERQALTSQRKLAAFLHSYLKQFTRADIMRWAQTRQYIGFFEVERDFDMPLSVDGPLAKDIATFVTLRHQALRKAPAVTPARSRKSVTSDTCLSPQMLAELLGRDAKSVRATLRKREKDIPPAWRLDDQRWGFKLDHKDDIVKLLGGGK